MEGEYKGSIQETFLAMRWRVREMKKESEIASIYDELRDRK